MKSSASARVDRPSGRRLLLARRNAIVAVAHARRAETV
jgi:hypothetical protein